MQDGSLNWDDLLGASDECEDELKPLNAWFFLSYALEGMAISEELARLRGSPLHQWFEEVSNAVHPLAFASVIGDELSRVGRHAATSRPADQLLVSLCKTLELVAWTERGSITYSK